MSRLIGGSQRTDYEKVEVDVWVSGSIEAVQFDPNRTYKAKDKDSGEWVEKTAPHVRFKFKLDGYQYPHYSRWMKSSTHEKSTLYSKYLKHLTPQFDCQDKVIDIDKLEGARIKVMYESNGEWQNVSNIRGVDLALNIIAPMQGEMKPSAAHDSTEEDDG